MASISKLVHDKLVELLGAIKIVDGYHNDIQFATKKYLDFEKIGSFPAVSVVRGPWKEVWDDESTTLKKRTATFGVIGYFKCDSDAGDTGIATDIADELEEDLNEALENSLQEIIDVEDGVQSVQIVSGEPIMNDEETRGVVQMIITIEWTHEANV